MKTLHIILIVILTVGLLYWLKKSGVVSKILYTPLTAGRPKITLTQETV